MRVRYSQRFLRQYASAPAEVRKAIEKQCGFLLENLSHPSLHAKKYDEALGLWQARVNRNWRFYFTIEGEEYRLHDVRPHPK
jgi:mRNA-degrading endonuclease RelE of RelBE toxin-antitoxin system